MSRIVRGAVAALVFTCFSGGPLYAADQKIAGKKFLVRNPSDASHRKVLGKGFEKNSSDTIVGNPPSNGASLEVIANGTTSSNQTFNLPKGGWTLIGGLGSFGFQYKSSSGAVRKARIRKTSSGNFEISVNLSGKNGALNIVPPNPGNDGGFILTLGGGDRYCVAFGGAAAGTELKDDSKTWSFKGPTNQVCPGASATTTTSNPGGATTTTTLGVAGCGLTFPQCNGGCDAGQVCSLIFVEPPGTSGCACVTGATGCNVDGFPGCDGDCGGMGSCAGNPGPEGGCACVPF